MALLCAPRIVQANSVAGFSPVETASAGISGNRAWSYYARGRAEETHESSYQTECDRYQSRRNIRTDPCGHRINRTGLYGDRDQRAYQLQRS